MKLMTFAELNELENGQQATAFTGRIKKVFDQKSGEGQYGLWWLQSIILTDEHANEITMTWSEEDAFKPDSEGKTITVESTYNGKNQLVGVKKDIRNKNGKHYESVKVDGRAKITFNGELKLPPYRPGIENEEGDQSADWPSSVPEGNKASSTPIKPNHSSDGIMEAKKHLLASARLYNLCVDAARTVVEDHAKQFWPDGLGGEMFRTCVSSLFIEATRAGMLEKMK